MLKNLCLKKKKNITLRKGGWVQKRATKSKLLFACPINYQIIARLAAPSLAV
jgi:hypothetical protein